MNGIVPPTIENPKSFIGLGNREIVVLGITAILTLLVIIAPIGLPIKIFFGVLMVGLGVAIAFGRDPKTGKTAEEYLFSILNFYSRARFQQKGAGPSENGPAVRIVAGSLGLDQNQDMASEYGNSFFKFAPIPLSGSFVFGIVSFAFFAALLVWIWGGGAAEFVSRYGMFSVLN